MESGINEGLSEVEPFSVRVEHISGTAFFQNIGHCLKRCQKELVELVALHGIVLDGKTAGTLEGNAVGRVRHDQVGAFAVHEPFYILSLGGVTTEQAVLAHGPEVAGFHEGCLLQCGGEVEVVVLGFFLVIREQVSQLVCIKAGQGQVKRLLLQGFNLDAQHFLVPARILGIAVVREDVGFALGVGQVVHQHAGHFGEAFLTCSHQPPMTSDHVVVLVDDYGVDEAKFP